MNHSQLEHLFQLATDRDLEILLRKFVDVYKPQYSLDIISMYIQYVVNVNDEIENKKTELRQQIFELQLESFYEGEV